MLAELFATLLFACAIRFINFDINTVNVDKQWHCAAGRSNIEMILRDSDVDWTLYSRYCNHTVCYSCWLHPVQSVL